MSFIALRDRAYLSAIEYYLYPVFLSRIEIALKYELTAYVVISPLIHYSSPFFSSFSLPMLKLNTRKEANFETLIRGPPPPLRVREKGSRSLSQ